MTPLKPGIITRPPIKEYLKSMLRFGVFRKQAKLEYTKIQDTEVWINEIYMVLVYRGNEIPPSMNPEQISDFIWLSLRRQDRSALLDWREIQQIKDQLIGEDCEAVQLFPRKERVVDASNQFHIFGVANPEMSFAFGFPTGGISQATFMKSKQRPLEDLK